ncbi:hypothetical protein HELRODRAFT_184781, partial [Helobdella robusta]|uniref:Uncharacterized protein n=1 Tax=Helobdella robusta TaxID=6412 RepID=T1FLZ4_HELRO
MKNSKVSQDTKDDLSSKDEEHFNNEEEKQDSDSEFRQSAKGQSSCDFITGTWSDIWFSGQLTLAIGFGTWSDIWFSGQVYNQDNYTNLAAVCKDHSKTIKTLRTFWSVEPTPISTQ